MILINLSQVVALENSKSDLVFDSAMFNDLVLSLNFLDEVNKQNQIKTNKGRDGIESQAESDRQKEKIEEWTAWFLGASGLRYGILYNMSFGGGYMGYGTIGPKYNFSSNEWSTIRSKGFSLSLPIGFGGIYASEENQSSFVLPIALEMNYMFSERLGFGVSSGIRYTYSPRSVRDLHMLDFYMGIDIYSGFYFEVGYMFYGFRSDYTSKTFSGSITTNIGLRI